MHSVLLWLENWNSCGGPPGCRGGLEPGESSTRAPLWPEPPQGRGRRHCREREGGRGERRGNSESGFQELRMREPELGGRGQGGLLQRGRGRGPSQGQGELGREAASPWPWPSHRAVWRVQPVWTLPEVGQEGARFCPCSISFFPHSSFFIPFQGLRRMTVSSHPLLLGLGFPIHCGIWTLHSWRGSQGSSAVWGGVCS